MKLYSILIYHKGADGTVRSFKSAFDLSSFSFFQRGSVQEFMQFTGKLLVERSGLGARSTVKENEYFCHCYVRSDGLAAVSVTDGEYQGAEELSENARVAMSMMTRVLDDFSAKVHAVQWEEVEETKIVMHNTIQSVLERGEKFKPI
ncbi:hypothetical protein COOONC_03291 [Cooperia oncophora]